MLAAHLTGSPQVDKHAPPATQNKAASAPQKSGLNTKLILWCLIAALLLLAIILFTPSLRNARTLPAEQGSAGQSGLATPATGKATQLRQPGGDRTPPAKKLRFGPLTRQHFSQFDQWIETAPRQHYFIQLLATDAHHTGEIEGFLNRATEVLDPADLRAYRSSLSGTDRVGVIYGDFPSREAASNAMQALPDSIKAAQPFPRQVAKLR